MPIIAKQQDASAKDSRLYKVRHSAAHLMAEAVQALWPDTKLAFGPPVDNGFYYDFLSEHNFTEDDLRRIEEKMRELRKKRAEFVCEPISRDDAVAFFTGRGEYLKAEHVGTLPPDNITLYRDGDFVDLCAGPHVGNTGEIEHFKLMNVSGSYWRGDEKRERLQRIYGTAWESKVDLEGYLHRLEESKKRDHRVLGKELALFDFPELAGPGLPFYLPHGAFILQQLKDWMWDLHMQGSYGHPDKIYEPLSTPHILKTDAWKISGHLENYRENMFMVYSLDELESGMLGTGEAGTIDGCADVSNAVAASSNHAPAARPPGEGIGNYGIKPMNCPGHIMMYNVGTKSYRDLPVRYFEFGTVYRYERAGVLHGMLRVRSFTQDDAHIFCTLDQYPDEVAAIFDFCCFVLDTFGFEYTVALKTRGEKRIGADAVWDVTEDGLRRVLEQRAPGKYYVMEGDAAFYGPKVDFIIKDSLGRDWQGSTIQLDFNLPERFGQEYIDSDGQPRQPVMIHRAILGSFERFFGLLVEEFGGAFPLWLAPEQARILPITDAQIPYAREVQSTLAARGLRVEIDGSSEKLGKKIRDGKTGKVPYLIVLGGREAENGTVGVESYFEGKLEAVTTVEELAARMLDEVASKAAPRRS